METRLFTITAVNDAPGFTRGPNQTIAEDAASQSISNWATAITAGPSNESGQSLTFNVTNNNNALFSSQPAISSTGTLTYTPATDRNGVATVTVYLRDDGGTANGGIDQSANQTFTITVSAVNDNPTNTVPAAQTVLEDTNLIFSGANGNQISVSDPDVAETANGRLQIHLTALNGILTLSQLTGLTFSLGDGTTDTEMIFEGLPANLNASLSGLIFRGYPADFNGSASLNIITSDLGNTGSGGVRVDNDNISISVTSVNDAPSFTRGSDQIVLEDAGAQTVATWATAISRGPANESAQTLTFVVTNDNNALFSVQPAISPATGNLTYTPAANAFGSAVVSVYLRDDGGTLNGGVDVSPTQIFNITVTPVNDAPSFTVGSNQTVAEDAAAQSIAGWATNISAGPANESAQTLIFTVTNNNNALFQAQPTISPATGTLTYTPAVNANGVATVSVYLRDSGGTANGGVDQSATQTFTITVSAVNDAPVLALIGNLSVCQLSLLTFTASATDIDLPANTLTYSLLSAPSGASIGASSGVFTWTPDNIQSGPYTFTVRVTDNGTLPANLTDQETITVTVNVAAQPTITASGPTTFCIGGSVTLSSSAGSTYLWSTGATTQSINVTTSGSYTVQVTNAAGCQSIASLATAVTVNALPSQPTITAGGSTTFCAGGSVTLTSSAGSTYLWSTGATTQSINVTTAGSYTVQVTNAAGCQSIASAATTVTVNALPSQPTITAGGPTTFCIGGSVTLTSSAGSTYLWSTGATTQSINVTTAGSYTVQDTNAAGCQSISSAATTVTVNALPAQPTITAGGSTTFCAGGSVTLTSSAGSSYLWSTGATTASINVTTAGSYTVQVTNAAGCQSIASAATTVTVNALPAQPTITAGGSDNVLCWRQCYSDLKCRVKLPVVYGCDDTEYQCHDLRELYSSGYQCSWLPEHSIGGDDSNGQRLTCSADYNGGRIDNVLCGRQCYSDLKCRIKLPVVYRSYYCKYQCHDGRELYSSGLPMQLVARA